MSCSACSDFQKKRPGSFFFRWKNANVEMLACKQHAMEIQAALRAAIRADYLDQGSLDFRDPVMLLRPHVFEPMGGGSPKCNHCGRIETDSEVHPL